MGILQIIVCHSVVDSRLEVNSVLVSEIGICQTLRTRSLDDVMLLWTHLLVGLCSQPRYASQFS